MRKTLAAALSVTLVLSACGAVRDSRLNPMNWFGRAEPAQTTAVAEKVDEDPRPLVDQVLSLSVEPMPNGAIVRATGLPPNQGWWDGELVAGEVDEEGRLVYDFRLTPPLDRTRVSTPRSRQVTVAAFLSNFKLDGISQIVVQGRTNALSSRR